MFARHIFSSEVISCPVCIARLVYSFDKLFIRFSLFILIRQFEFDFIAGQHG